MKKGVPECMKAKFRSNSPRQVRKGSMGDTPSSRTRRFSTPTAPYYGLSTTHIAPSRKLRSATPTQEREPSAVVTSARRRSLTPTLTRSTTATMEPPTQKSWTWGSPKKKKVSKATTKTNPKPVSKSAASTPTAAAAGPRDPSPTREKQEESTAAVKRTPATVIKTTRTASPAPSAEKSLLVDIASPRSASTQVHKAVKRPNASTTLTFSRPKPFSTSTTIDHHPSPVSGINVIPSPSSRRSVTMTQSQPRKPKSHKPTFIASLPLPPRNGRYQSTVVFDLDQTLVNAHSEDDTVIPRPGILESLEAISKCGCERVMWTASNEAQAKFVIKKIPGLGMCFDYIVTWDTLGWGKRRDYVKDILKLKRSIRDSIVIDNDSLVVRPHIQNAIVVEDFGDLRGGSIQEQDSTMADTAAFIQHLSSQKEMDVPGFVRSYADWTGGKKKLGYYRLPPASNLTGTPRTGSPARVPTHTSPPRQPTIITTSKRAFQRTTTVKKRPTSPVRPFM
eukprot:TRINITY_DN1205_c0_g1_i2.p1 TRINITY_DN1205_c0_g1~~TRINITY_DN1205_c0_g1_i2.p1  ORF type:complete len:569 (+),score=110.28 TRINITY_DN1205_c0_g1_i2:195-1709(+)